MSFLDSIPFCFSRARNALRCSISYALSLFGFVRISHLPAFVSVEPANFCQLRCPECPVGQAGGHPRKPEFLSEAVWQQVLHEVAPYAHTIQFYFQGEPLLFPNLPRTISEAHALGLHTIVSTNAQALTPSLADALVSSGLSRIIVSMDGLSDASYSAYRQGGSLRQTQDALRWLHEAKQRHHSRITIELQCLRLRTNEHEWSAFRRTYRALGADCFTLKTAQLYDFAHGHPLMPSDPRHSRYVRGSDGLYRRRESLFRTLWRRLFALYPCWRLWSGCVITTDGEVLPCCYDKDHTHSYGNLLQSSLSDCFRTGSLSFRRAVLRSARSRAPQTTDSQFPAICQTCHW